MKAAVNHLEQFMEKADTAARGKVILATVKGDVHDIGKNLVEIILANNGYEVVNLGIKVPPDVLIQACREHHPDAIGLSGLLVKSTQQMVITAADTLLFELRGKADHILVDMHAEATSEKVAMGWHLDGRVTAVLGTHTHVPTADARVLPGGTAYVTDVGMTGARGGVLGVKRELAVDALVTQMPVRFAPSDDDPWLNAVLVSASESLRADSIEQLLIEAG